MNDAKPMTTRKRPSPRAGAATAPRKSEATRQRILDAAARVFRESGYSGTRLTDIAALADMKAGSLYYHFDSRETLVEEVMALGLRRTHSTVLARLDALPPGTSHVERLRTAIEAHLLTVLEQEDITSATIKLIWQVPPEIRERQLASQRAYGAVWRKLLQAAQEAGEIRADANLSVIRMAIMGALNWSADWYKPGGASAEQVSHDIAAMVLHGLATPKRGRS